MNSLAFEGPEGTRPCQGAFYKDIRLVFDMTLDGTGAIKDFQTFPYPYAVVLTQECDLAQHAGVTAFLSSARADDAEKQKDEKRIRDKRDKLLPSVLLCPAYPAYQFRKGIHIATILSPDEVDGNRGIEDYYVSHIISDDFKKVQNNDVPRYHYLSAAREEYQVPETVVDFKHYFTLPTETLIRSYSSEMHYIARLRPLYREHVSQRFAAFLSRIGLEITHRRIQNPPTTGGQCTVGE